MDGPICEHRPNGQRPPNSRPWPAQAAITMPPGRSMVNTAIFLVCGLSPSPSAESRSHAVGHSVPAAFGRRAARPRSATTEKRRARSRAPFRPGTLCSRSGPTPKLHAVGGSLPACTEQHRSPAVRAPTRIGRPSPTSPLRGVDELSHCEQAWSIVSSARGPEPALSSIISRG